MKLKIMRTILLTGATGFLGGVILKKLIAKFPDTKIYCIVRPIKNQLVERRLKEYISNSNIHVISGDISLPKLNLSVKDYQYYVENIDTIIHSAASIKFNAPMKYLEKHNIFATDEMVKLAKIIGEKQKKKATFIHISTAYQAGKSDAFISEIFTPKPLEGFKNNYEESKWICEQHIKSNLSKVHFIVLRPSIILASETGKCSANGVGIDVFELINKKSRKLPSVVPVTKKLRLDFVTVDYVANSCIELLNVIDNIPNGCIFHLSDSNGGMTAKKGIDISYKSLGIKLFGINIKIVKRIVEILSKFTNLISTRDKKIMDNYLDYFGTNPTFETKNLSFYLQKEIITTTSEEIYRSAIKYWVENIHKS